MPNDSASTTSPAQAERGGGMPTAGGGSGPTAGPPRMPMPSTSPLVAGIVASDDEPGDKTML
jgi:hypothetical protein